MNSGFYLHESLIFFLFTVCALAFILGIFLGKPVIRWLKKRNHYDQVHKEYCEKLEVLHQDKKHTPTAGGILFFSYCYSRFFLAALRETLNMVICVFDNQLDQSRVVR
ncbi:phospho-N-acetylmuramoyl-pentapeptide-transferase domain protein [Chlamydia psittaci 84/55]|nr:phospho-N-acetylmuramoyl-pentapeptide-transferase domain protein [Chlamydia psittaci 84/55]